MDGFLLEDLAEVHKLDIPKDFFLYLRFAEQEWIADRPVEPWSFRGAEDGYGTKLADAIFMEIGKLLCTKDNTYSEVRANGRAITNAGISAVAGVIAVKFGLVLAVASSAVAFVALVVLRVGQKVFCRLHKSHRMKSA